MKDFPGQTRGEEVLLMNDNEVDFICQKKVLNRSQYSIERNAFLIKSGSRALRPYDCFPYMTSINNDPKHNCSVELNRILSKPPELLIFDSLCIRQA